MALSSSTATSRANKCLRGEESSSQPSEEKYSFKGKRLTSQTKHERGGIFWKESKKSKGHANALERVTKATGKTGHVVKTVHELACSLRYFTSNYQESLCRIREGRQRFPFPIEESHVHKDPDSFDREAL